MKQLQNEDVDIVLIVRKGWEKKIINKNKLTDFILTKDMFSEDVDWWARVFKGINIVIHAAWYAEPGKYLMSDKNLSCLQGTLNMAKGAVLSEVEKFVGIGTCFEYDLSGGVLSTDTPLKPITPYAAMKAAAYLSLSQWFLEKEVEFAWCRLFYLFGEGEDTRRLVPYIKSRLKNNKVAELSSGNQIRDFMDVSDAGNVICDTALGKTSGAVNVCSGKPVTVRQLSENIAKAYGNKNLLKFGAKPENKVDPFCVIGIPSKIN